MSQHFWGKKTRQFIETLKITIKRGGKDELHFDNNNDGVVEKEEKRWKYKMQRRDNYSVKGKDRYVSSKKNFSSFWSILLLLYNIGTYYQSGANTTTMYLASYKCTTISNWFNMIKSLHKRQHQAVIQLTARVMYIFLFSPKRNLSFHSQLNSNQRILRAKAHLQHYPKWTKTRCFKVSH